MLFAMATVPLNAQRKAKVPNLAACPAWGAEQRGSTTARWWADKNGGAVGSRCVYPRQ